jgi:deoxycytidylate deaminase
MPEAARKLGSIALKPDLDERELKKKIQDTHTEEIIIGLCGPIGTDIHFVADEIGRIVEEKYGYKCILIRLSNFIKQFGSQKDTEDKFSYYNELISEGNRLRETNGKSVLAELAISEIALNREIIRKKSNSEAFASNRVCYIIDSIKNKEELQLFRLIYRDLFYFIGVFSNLETRVRNLEKQSISTSDVYKLIDRDSGEEIQFGQQVSNTFIEADFFLRIDQTLAGDITHRLERFISLIFNSEIITPTINETAMYQAFAAAKNSACLSRQVGAAITNKNGEILGVGWNDVPKACGGVYTYSDRDPLASQDFRCLNLDGGKCFNDEEKDLIRNQLLQTLISNGLIDRENESKAVEIIKKSRIKELIEFSRAVHAEMHAIITSSQKAGVEVINGKLYCTTYPCHNCARHIVAAGIKEVYYIEPYRKSLAIKLHNDSITENENDQDKVKILMFDGVSPKRFLELFKIATPRKENGKKKQANKREIHPKNTLSLQAIPLLEKEIIKELKSKNLITIEDSEEEEKK